MVIDWNGPISMGENDGVVVPSTCIPCNEADIEELTRTISPCTPSSDHGIDLYMATLTFIATRVHV